MPHRSEPEHEAAGGHYVTAGMAIAGLGCSGLLTATLLHFSFNFRFGFIDARAMATVCFIFLVIGFWMISSGRRGQDRESNERMKASR